jgi:hypothetical protein
MAQANSGDFPVDEARLSFSEGLWEPVSQGAQGGDPKYGCTLIFKEGGPAHNALKLNVAKVVEMKWGPKGLDDFRKGLIKNPIFDGNGPKAHNQKTGELWSGFGPGTVFIRCKNNADAPPRVFFRSRLVDATKDEVYSGCYGRAALNAYTWEHATGGRGVTFNIRMFQKLKDGEVLGGRTPVDVDKWFVETEDDGSGTEPVVDIFS